MDNDTAVVAKEQLLPVPAELESRVEKFVNLMEEGVQTRDALAQSNLTPQQVAVVVCKRPQIKKRIELIREIDAEKRRMYVRETEERAMQLIRGDESVETHEEFESGPKGDTTRKKTIKRSVSHDKLMEKMLDLDAEYRKSKNGESGAAANGIVAVAVHFHGIDLERMKQGNTEHMEGATAAIINIQANKQSQADRESEVIEPIMEEK